VAQEAAASGVVPIVTDKGGPKFLVTHGETGFVAASLEDFRDRVIELMDDPEKLDRMRREARRSAESKSWDAIFESVYAAYSETIRLEDEKKSSLEKSTAEAA
jgi:phosphatidylinositol alpha 1,6-mannosyltransferase